MSYHIRIIGDDGQIEDRVYVLCDDDDKAIRITKKFANGRAVELWDGKRKIADLNQKK